MHLSDRYCIEITPHANKGDAIIILKNDQEVDTTPYLNDFNETHTTCFDSFLPSHDKIELRNGGKNEVRISLKLKNGGNRTELFFGQNADLNSVVIDENENECTKQNEKASTIIIYDERVIQSECLGEFTKYAYDRIFLLTRCFKLTPKESVPKIEDDIQKS